MSTPPTETSLIAAAQSGDRAALGELLMMHADMLARRLAPRVPRSLQRTTSVDDILQQTFADAFRDVARFEPREPGSFFAWLQTIAENRLRNSIKAAQRQKRGGQRSQFDPPPDALTSVRDLLIQRGGTPTRPLPNPYVKGLGSQRKGAQFALLDDLLVGALIEARSCERFVALYRGIRAAGGDLDLAAFYERLARSESGHANLFLGLAESVFEGALVRSELERRCGIEAATLEALPVTPRMHGGHAPA